MQIFDSEFHTLQYIILRSKRLLLFAHSRPDPDTVGANLALAEYIRNCGKHVDIACFDAFPDMLKTRSIALKYNPGPINPGPFQYHQKI